MMTLSMTVFFEGVNASRMSSSFECIGDGHHDVVSHYMSYTAYGSSYTAYGSSYPAYGARYDGDVVYRSPDDADVP
jgi:hypothetical protein